MEHPPRIKVETRIIGRDLDAEKYLEITKDMLFYLGHVNRLMNEAENHGFCFALTKP